MITKPIAEVLFKKYFKDGAVINTEFKPETGFVITKWVHPDGIPQPTEDQILSDISQYEIDSFSESNNKRGRKRQLLDALATLTGLTRKQVLKCFNEIVKDGTDE